MPLQADSLPLLGSGKSLFFLRNFCAACCQSLNAWRWHISHNSTAGHDRDKPHRAQDRASGRGTCGQPPPAVHVAEYVRPNNRSLASLHRQDARAAASQLRARRGAQRPPPRCRTISLLMVPPALELRKGGLLLGRVFLVCVRDTRSASGRVPHGCLLYTSPSPRDS